MTCSSHLRCVIVGSLHALRGICGYGSLYDGLRVGGGVWEVVENAELCTERAAGVGMMAGVQMWRCVRTFITEVAWLRPLSVALSGLYVSRRGMSEAWKHQELLERGVEEWLCGRIKLNMTIQPKGTFTVLSTARFRHPPESVRRSRQSISEHCPRTRSGPQVNIGQDSLTKQVLYLRRTSRTRRTGRHPLDLAHTDLSGAFARSCWA